MIDIAAEVDSSGAWCGFRDVDPDVTHGSYQQQGVLQPHQGNADFIFRPSDVRIPTCQMTNPAAMCSYSDNSSSTPRHGVHVASESGPPMRRKPTTVLLRHQSSAVSRAGHRASGRAATPSDRSCLWGRQETLLDQFMGVSEASSAQTKVYISETLSPSGPLLNGRRPRHRVRRRSGCDQRARRHRLARWCPPQRAAPRRAVPHPRPIVRPRYEVRPDGVRRGSAFGSAPARDRWGCDNAPLRTAQVGHEPAARSRETTYCR